MPDYHAIFEAPAEAKQVELTTTSGEVPAELKGALLRNGPGIQRAGKTPMHFLDGYAFVVSAAFDKGRVVYSARNVALPVAAREAEAGQLLHRRPFTNRPGGRLANLFRMKLTTGASHEVYTWGGAVVASDVDGHYLLDPVTLETKGPAPINRMVGGLTTLSAMPRVDRFSGNLVAFAATPAVFGPDTVTMVELDGTWTERARVERALSTKGALLHDMASTENHYLVVQFGVLSPGKAAGAGSYFLDAVSLPPRGARILAIPRRGNGPVREMPLPDGFQTFHIGNAYEEAGMLVVDTTIYEGLLDFGPLYPPELRPAGTPSRPGGGPFVARHTLNLATGEHKVAVHREALGEAPSVRDDRSGRRHRFAYTSAQGTRGDEPVDNAYYWYHAVAKIDCDAGTTVSRWDAGPQVYVAAPQFVARGDAEDDGWVLTWTHDVAAKRGELVVLDAKDLARGPVARLALPAPLPPASHVCWS